MKTHLSPALAILYLFLGTFIAIVVIVAWFFFTGEKVISEEISRDEKRRGN